MKSKRHNQPRLLLPSLFIFAMLFACEKKPTSTTVDEEAFNQHVRNTEALSPEEERAALIVPEGFEIQLFASEPNIGKPLNMAFDARGRMWLTQSYEYPFPDTSGQPRDKITILEDTNGDGQADTFTTFADSLNIPIGIIAVPNGAVAYSIPSIYHLIDHNGDDKVDERKVLYTGFRYEDTHGMINNMERSWDGWVHADHGFSNSSTVAGTDGDTIVMVSGNTFRFRLDGSRVEFTTTGRVNPYGYAYDEMGYTYSTDCHSSPLYQLVRGADYPHFGKKPTGIGFGPALMSHDYGSTALAGLEYYLGEQFPAEYQNSFYLGDVVKCRVLRNTIEMKGTTPVVTWQPDFVVSKDPWFRPVDVALGPDGAIYVADFYNRIIGHYEVPLDHPGRDRQRGRIWRITYKGNKATPLHDWSKATLEELIAGLDNANLPLRMSLADQIVDRFQSNAVEPVLNKLKATGTTTHQHVQGLWILYRLGALPDEVLAAALKHPDVVVQVHALRIAFEIAGPSNAILDLVFEALKSPSPHVQREAVLVAAKNPRLERVNELLALGKAIPGEDTHLKYSIKQSLRDHLRQPDILAWAIKNTWNEDDSKALAAAMVGVDQPDAARFLSTHLKNYEEPPAVLQDYAKHAARFLAPSEFEELVVNLRYATTGKSDLEYALHRSLQEGLAQAGKKMGAQGQAWGEYLATLFLQQAAQEKAKWRISPDEHIPYRVNPWRVIEKEIDGQSIAFFAGGPMDGNGGDISIAYSPEFTLPESISFVLLGQKNKPGETETPIPPVNKVSLHLAEGHQLLHEQYITEGDTLWRINWPTREHAGKKAYLVLTDASNSWAESVAIGSIDPPVVSLPALSPDQLAEKLIFAGQIAHTYRATSLKPALAQLLNDPSGDIYARKAAAQALLAIDEQASLAWIDALLGAEQEPLLLKQQLAGSLSNLASAKAMAVLSKHLSALPYQSQKEIALAWAGTKAGIVPLFHAAAASSIAPRLLLEPQVQERLLPKLSPNQKQQLSTLTANAKPPGESVQRLIDQRLRNFGLERHSVEQGKAIFTQNCALCHQMKGVGGNIGPQLDGIGNWGSRALTEKILDPNRNISKAFKNYTLELKDGKSLSGLFRREEGQVLVFADLAGREFSIDKKDIAQQRLSPYTLMPDNFGQVIPEKDYYALLAYLLSER